MHTRLDFDLAQLAYDSAEPDYYEDEDHDDDEDEDDEDDLDIVPPVMG